MCLSNYDSYIKYFCKIAGCSDAKFKKDFAKMHLFPRDECVAYYVDTAS